MLGISIALNSLSTHGTCTAVFVAVAAIAGFALASIQTLGKISWLAWIGLAGILSAIFTLTIAVGVQDRPASAPKDGPFEHLEKENEHDGTSFVLIVPRSSLVGKASLMGIDKRPASSIESFVIAMSLFI